MDPLDFEKFCWANGMGEHAITYLKKDFINKKGVSESTDERMLELFKEYIIVGGMPKVVSSFVENHHFGLVLKEQKKILNEFTSKFKILVSESFGYFVGDNISENFYYAFMLGLLVSLKDTYYITSNRESEKGRYDILMKPKDKSMPSFILEFKVVDNNNFINTIDDAKNQVNSLEYDTILKQEGYENIQKLVFAFQGKDVEIEVF